MVTEVCARYTSLLRKDSSSLSCGSPVGGGDDANAKEREVIVLLAAKTMVGELELTSPDKTRNCGVTATSLVVGYEIPFDSLQVPRRPVSLCIDQYRNVSIIHVVYVCTNIIHARCTHTYIYLYIYTHTHTAGADASRRNAGLQDHDQHRPHHVDPLAAHARDLRGRGRRASALR